MNGISIFKKGAWAWNTNKKRHIMGLRNTNKEKLCFISPLTLVAEELSEKRVRWGEDSRALRRKQVEQLRYGTDASVLHIPQTWQISRQWHQTQHLNK